MTRMRLILLALAIGLLAAQLTACMQLPRAVVSEMQPATPPAANHYQKPPQPAATPPHAATAQ
jgi:hypothetical protein